LVRPGALPTPRRGPAHSKAGGEEFPIDGRSPLDAPEGKLDTVILRDVTACSVMRSARSTA
jgi:hypothetical protein